MQRENPMMDSMNHCPTHIALPKSPYVHGRKHASSAVHVPVWGEGGQVVPLLSAERAGLVAVSHWRGDAGEVEGVPALRGEQRLAGARPLPLQADGAHLLRDRQRERQQGGRERGMWGWPDGPKNLTLNEQLVFILFIFFSVKSEKVGKWTEASLENGRGRSHICPTNTNMKCKKTSNGTCHF